MNSIISYSQENLKQFKETPAVSSGRSNLPEISLAATRPILATGLKYILTNRNTKTKNALILLNENFEKLTINVPIELEIIDAVWVEKCDAFLIMTESRFFSLDLDKRNITEITDMKGKNGEVFKCCTMIDSNSVLIACDKWGTESLIQYKYDEHNQRWQPAEKIVLNLSQNQFIEDIALVHKSNKLLLALIIYDDNHHYWLIEFRQLEDSKVVKRTHFHDKNIQNKYAILPSKSPDSNTLCWIYSVTGKMLTTINQEFQAMIFSQDQNIVKMGLFADTWLIVRTSKSVYRISRKEQSSQLEAN